MKTYLWLNYSIHRGDDAICSKHRKLNWLKNNKNYYTNVLIKAFNISYKIFSTSTLSTFNDFIIRTFDVKILYSVSSKTLENGLKMKMMKHEEETKCVMSSTRTLFNTVIIITYKHHHHHLPSLPVHIEWTWLSFPAPFHYDLISDIKWCNNVCFVLY